MQYAGIQINLALQPECSLVLAASPYGIEGGSTCAGRGPPHPLRDVSLPTPDYCTPSWQVIRSLSKPGLARKMNGTLTSRQLHAHLQDTEAKRNGLVEVVITWSGLSKRADNICRAFLMKSMSLKKVWKVWSQKGPARRLLR